MDEPRLTEAQMIAQARSAVRKVDLHGRRGATLVTLDETIAMAGALVALGIGTIPLTEEDAQDDDA